MSFPSGGMSLTEILSRSLRLLLSHFPVLFAAIWLVIVADGFALSSTVNFPDAIRNHSFTSSFDRVFIFENAAERSFELTLPTSIVDSSS